MREPLLTLLFYALILLSGCFLNQNAPRSNEAAIKQKLDPFLFIEIKEGKPEKTLDVIIRTKEKVSKEQEKILTDRGARINSILGDIITASVPSEYISKVAELNFVVYVQLSRKLNPEGGR